jgi:hypothetical protein
LSKQTPSSSGDGISAREEFDLSRVTPLDATGSINNIRSFIPQLGLASGGGLVEIIADGIGFNGDYVCVFGDKEVQGIVTKFNSASCLAPRNNPSNVSLSLRNR